MSSKTSYKQRLRRMVRVQGNRVFPLKSLAIGFPILEDCVCFGCGSIHDKLIEREHAQYLWSWRWAYHLVISCPDCRRDFEVGMERKVNRYGS